MSESRNDEITGTEHRSSNEVSQETENDAECDTLSARLSASQRELQHIPSLQRVPGSSQKPELPAQPQASALSRTSSQQLFQALAAHHGIDEHEAARLVETSGEDILTAQRSFLKKQEAQQTMARVLRRTSTGGCLEPNAVLSATPKPKAVLRRLPRRGVSELPLNLIQRQRQQQKLQLDPIGRRLSGQLDGTPGTFPGPADVPPRQRSDLQSAAMQFLYGTGPQALGLTASESMDRLTWDQAALDVSGPPASPSGRGSPALGSGKFRRSSLGLPPGAAPHPGGPGHVSFLNVLLGRGEATDAGANPQGSWEPTQEQFSSGKGPPPSTFSRRATRSSRTQFPSQSEPVLHGDYDALAGVGWSGNQAAGSFEGKKLGWVGEGGAFSRQGSRSSGGADKLSRMSTLNSERNELSRVDSASVAGHMLSRSNSASVPREEEAEPPHELLRAETGASSEPSQEQRLEHHVSVHSMGSAHSEGPDAAMKLEVRTTRRLPKAKRMEAQMSAAAAEDAEQAAAIIKAASRMIQDAPALPGSHDLTEQPLSWPRRMAIWILWQPDFQNIVLLLILANCITLAMYDPTGRLAHRNKVLMWIELGLNITFTLEVIIRATAIGSFLQYTRNPWSAFDVLLVLVGYTVLIPTQQHHSLKAVRALRALRPLRTISRVEGVRAVVVCFVEALPLLVSSGALLLLFMFIFAVAGLQIYEGRYRFMCQDPITGEWERGASDPDEFGCPRRPCPSSMVCRLLPRDAVFNAGNFDNIGVSMLTVFQATTLNGWTTIMYRAMDTTTPYSAGLFVLLVIICAYFVVNLFLAVLKIKFGRAQALFHSKLNTARGQQKTRRGVLGTLVIYIKDKMQESARKRSLTYKTYEALLSPSEATLQSLRERTRTASGVSSDSPLLDAFPAISLPQDDTTAPARRAPSVSWGEGVKEGTSSDLGLKRGSSAMSPGDANKKDEEQAPDANLPDTPAMTTSEFAQLTRSIQQPRRWALRLRFSLRQWVQSPAFNHTFLTAIIINTLVMATEHDGMSSLWELVMYWSNIVLTGVFTVEVTSKMLGCTMREFLHDRMNLFDTVVVAVSLVDVGILAGTMVQLEKLVVLRVLRAFRVLRILKVFRYLPSLRKLTQVLVSSFQSFFGVILLTALFLLVYATIGLHIFGGTRLDVVWPNFDNFLNSLILIFNVLTQEDWTVYLYSLVRSTNWGSSIYIVSWAMLGPYIFLTLFMAVTLEAFESKYDKETIEMVTALVRRSNTRNARMSFSWGLSRSGTKGSEAGSTTSRRNRRASWFMPTPGTGPFGRSITGGSARPSLDTQTQELQAIYEETLKNERAAGEPKGPSPLSRPVGEGLEAELTLASGGTGGTHAVQLHVTARMVQSCTDVSNEQGRAQWRACGTPHSREGGCRACRHATLESPELCLSPDSQSGASSQGLRGAGPVAEGYEPDPMGDAPIDPGPWHFYQSQLYSPTALDPGAKPHPDAELISANWHGAGREGTGEGAHRAQRHKEVGRGSNDTDTGTAGAAAIPRLHLTATATAASARRGSPSGTASPAANFQEAKRRLSSGPVGAPSREAPQSPAPGAESEEALEAPSLTWRHYGTSGGLSLGAPSSVPAPGEASSAQWDKERREQAAGTSSSPLAPMHLASPPPSAATGLAHAERPPSGHFKFRKDSAHDMRHLLEHPPSTSRGQVVGAGAAPSHGPLHPAAEDCEDSASAISSGEPLPPQLLLHAELVAILEGSLTGTGATRTGSGFVAPLRHAAHRASSTTANSEPLPWVLQDTSVPRITSTSLRPSLDLRGSAGRRGPLSEERSRRIRSLDYGRLRQTQSAAPASSDTQRQDRHMSLDIKRTCMEDTGTGTSLIHRGSMQLMENGRGPLHDEGAWVGNHAPGASELAGRPDTTEAGEEGLMTASPGVIHESLRTSLASIPQESEGEMRAMLSAEAQQAQEDLQFATTTHAEAPESPRPSGSRGRSVCYSPRPQEQQDYAQADPGTSAGEMRDMEQHPGRMGRAGSAVGRGASRISFRMPSGLADGEREARTLSRSSTSGIAAATGKERDEQAFPPLEGSEPSLFLLHCNHPLRVRLYNLTTHPRFDGAMLLVIMANCALMTCESPRIRTGSRIDLVIFWGDVMFTSIFSIEAAAKILAFTFMGYFQFNTNKLDMLVVVTSVITDIFRAAGGANAGWLKTVTVLRALKPLRMITRSSGLKAVFRSLTLSMAGMGNVSLLVLLFFIIFGILGVQLFAGRFWRCNDTSVAGKTECVGDYVNTTTGVLTPRVWSNSFYNFDHLGAALLSLCFALSLDGYVPILQDAMSAPVFKGDQPQPYSNPLAFIYFAFFITVCTFTLLNLYTGVVFFQFSRIKLLSQAGSAFLSTQQKEWIELSRLVFKTQPLTHDTAPQHWLQKRCLQLSRNVLFKRCITAVILANTLLLAATWNDEPLVWSHVREYLNNVFTVAYLFEALVKIRATGMAMYWKYGWNRFDFILVLAAVSDLALSNAPISDKTGLLGVQKTLRVLRVLRILKLVRSLKGVHSLFQALLASIPAFANVAGLIALVMFIYAYLGVRLFGRVKRGPALNSHANFELFSTAALTLFRVATHDNWEGIVQDCMVSPPHCDPGKHECGSWVAVPYFLTFVMLVSIILLNVFSAVIIENFEQLYEQDQWRLKPQALQAFTELWAQYDDGTATISPSDLEKLLLQLRPPLGLGASADGSMVLRFVYGMDIPLVDGRVPFHKTLFELVKRCSGSELPEGQLRTGLEKLVHRAFDHLIQNSEVTFGLVMTVMRIQRRWRAKMRSNRMRQRRQYRAARCGLDVRDAEELLDRRNAWLATHDSIRKDGSSRWTLNSIYASWMVLPDSGVAARGLLKIVRNLYGTAGYWNRTAAAGTAARTGSVPQVVPEQKVSGIRNIATAVVAGARLKHIRTAGQELAGPGTSTDQPPPSPGARWIGNQSRRFLFSATSFSVRSRDPTTPKSGVSPIGEQPPTPQGPQLLGWRSFASRPRHTDSTGVASTPARAASGPLQMPQDGRRSTGESVAGSTGTVLKRLSTRQNSRMGTDPALSARRSSSARSIPGGAEEPGWDQTVSRHGSEFAVSTLGHYSGGEQQEQVFRRDSWRPRAREPDETDGLPEWLLALQGMQAAEEEEDDPLFVLARAARDRQEAEAAEPAAAAAAAVAAERPASPAPAPERRLQPPPASRLSMRLRTSQRENGESATPISGSRSADPPAAPLPGQQHHSAGGFAGDPVADGLLRLLPGNLAPTPRRGSRPSSLTSVTPPNLPGMPAEEDDPPLRGPQRTTAASRHGSLLHTHSLELLDLLGDEDDPFGAGDMLGMSRRGSASHKLHVPGGTQSLTCAARPQSPHHETCPDPTWDFGASRRGSWQAPGAQVQRQVSHQRSQARRDEAEGQGQYSRLMSQIQRDEDEQDRLLVRQGTNGGIHTAFVPTGVREREHIRISSTLLPTFDQPPG